MICAPEGGDIYMQQIDAFAFGQQHKTHQREGENESSRSNTPSSFVVSGTKLMCRRWYGPHGLRDKLCEPVHAAGTGQTVWGRPNDAKVVGVASHKLAIDRCVGALLVLPRTLQLERTLHLILKGVNEALSHAAACPPGGTLFEERVDKR